MKRTGLSVVFLVGLSGAALADYIEFQSPTGNISCGLYADGGETWVRCDMYELKQTYTTPPPDCELDWGSSFSLGKNGKGQLACVSDPAAGPNAPVLEYGDAVSLGGVSCISAKTGMTCMNGEGHGFTIAKAKQNLY